MLIINSNIQSPARDYWCERCKAKRYTSICKSCNGLTNIIMNENIQMPILLIGNKNNATIPTEAVQS